MGPFQGGKGVLGDERAVLGELDRKTVRVDFRGLRRTGGEVREVFLLGRRPGVRLFHQFQRLQGAGGVAAVVLRLAAKLVHEVGLSFGEGVREGDDGGVFRRFQEETRKPDGLGRFGESLRRILQVFKRRRGGVGRGQGRGEEEEKENGGFSHGEILLKLL